MLVVKPFCTHASAELAPAMAEIKHLCEICLFKMASHSNHQILKSQDQGKIPGYEKIAYILDRSPYIPITRAAPRTDNTRRGKWSSVDASDMFVDKNTGYNQTDDVILRQCN